MKHILAISLLMAMCCHAQTPTQKCKAGEYLANSGKCLHDQTGEKHPAGDGCNTTTCFDPACNYGSTTLAACSQLNDPAPVESTTPKCQVWWALETTGSFSHGDWISCDDANAWVAQLNSSGYRVMSVASLDLAPSVMQSNVNPAIWEPAVKQPFHPMYSPACLAVDVEKEFIAPPWIRNGNGPWTMTCPQGYSYQIKGERHPRLWTREPSVLDNCIIDVCAEDPQQIAPVPLVKHWYITDKAGNRLVRCRGDRTRCRLVNGARLDDVAREWGAK